MVSDRLASRGSRAWIASAVLHIQCLVECERGLLPHLRDVPVRSSNRASGRSRSTPTKQARPVLLRSSRTPPYPSSTVLISRDPNPACRRCFTSGPPCSAKAMASSVQVELRTLPSHLSLCLWQYRYAEESSLLTSGGDEVEKRTPS
jgi:hypothetical protein